MSVPVRVNVRDLLLFQDYTERSAHSTDAPPYCHRFLWLGVNAWPFVTSVGASTPCVCVCVYSFKYDTGRTRILISPAK